MKLGWLCLCLSFSACRGASFQGDQELGGAGAWRPVFHTGGASGDAADECGAQPVSLAELHAGRVRPQVLVALPQLVASSQKFLVFGDQVR